MTARKLIEFGDYRLVRVHQRFTALEVKDGSDWLGVARWRCAAMRNAAFREVKLDDGRTITCVDRTWVEDRLNELGDAMMREKKRGRRARRSR